MVSCVGEAETVHQGSHWLSCLCGRGLPPILMSALYGMITVFRPYPSFPDVVLVLVLACLPTGHLYGNTHDAAVIFDALMTQHHANHEQSLTAADRPLLCQ